MKQLELLEMRLVLGGEDPNDPDNPSIPPDEPVDPQAAPKYVYFKPGKTLREKV